MANSYFDVLEIINARFLLTNCVFYMVYKVYRVYRVLSLEKIGHEETIVLRSYFGLPSLPHVYRNYNLLIFRILTFAVLDFLKKLPKTGSRFGSFSD